MSARTGARVATWALRAAFARAMAGIYGREVPAYLTLVGACEQVNAEVLRRDGAAAERLGSIGRVTAERHGAIRVGTPAELAQVATVFAALGMHPVGFYDLRDAARSAVPVVSTAFRPVDAGELARNPFRMFTSLLVTDDRRFFDAGLQARLDAFLSRRTLFPAELLALSERAAADGGLAEEAAQRFLHLATAAFTLSEAPIDRAWYRELERVSAVAADIGGVTSTHVNHLTPRVLDIDALYRRMAGLGITMIDAIQGPPRWKGPDVLLRQTSFRALDEVRRFAEPDGAVVDGTLRVRFGEVESRGIALTPAGRDRYDAMVAETDRRMAGTGLTGRELAEQRQDAAESVWNEMLPGDEPGLLREGLAYFTVDGTAAAAGGAELAAEVAAGEVSASPIVYEDFLPRSAAGIFQSNLTGDGMRDDSRSGAARDVGWLSDVIGAAVADPYALYQTQQDSSLRR